jgi:glycosyltransferase involved in cell wall biosynthesis
MKDQKNMQKHMAEESSRANLGFVITSVNMKKHMQHKFAKITRSKKIIGFKVSRVKNEEIINNISKTEAGFISQKINMATSKKYQDLLSRLRRIYWQISVEKNKIVVHPARLGIRKRLHAMMMFIIMKANYDDLHNLVLNYWFEFKQYLAGNKSFTVNKKSALTQANNLNSYINFKSSYLGFSKTIIGQTKKMAFLVKKLPKLVNLNSIDIIDDPALQPFISVHLAFYNEENVAERCIEACLAQDYKQYEIIIADDSNDSTPQILAKYAHHPKIKIVHRENREGFKGGALKEAIKHTDKRAKFINIYDADFVPPPNTLKNFMKEFFVQNGNSFDLSSKDKNLAAVQGYQWHILNKDENFVTSGIRFGFAGGYMVERVAQQYFGAMKMIAGSVFLIRRDVMEKFGWQMPDGYTSIVEDWNLTIRMYIAGWKIGYTPDIKVPAECVNSLTRLSKQQIRWAEGHTWNVKKYFCFI